MPFSFDGPIQAGNDATLTCHILKGDLPVTLTWSFHGKKLSSSMGMSTFKAGRKISILSIESVMSGHSGNYTCTARNSAGLANYTTELIVNGTVVLPIDVVVLLPQILSPQPTSPHFPLL